MKIIDYTDCPFCNSRLISVNTGTSTNRHYMCNDCKRYTWYQNLMPNNLSVTQSFYDEHNDYNIIVFSFHGNENANQIVMRKGYSDLCELIDVKDFNHLKEKLEQLAVFS